MDWFRVTYFVDVQARDAEHAFEVSYWDGLRAQHAAASLPANLTYSAKPIDEPARHRPLPWSNKPHPQPKRGDATEWVLIAGIALLTTLQAVGTYFLIRAVLVQF